MRIGSFGQTVFSVSTDRVLTPSSFSRSVAARYEEHKGLYTKEGGKAIFQGIFRHVHYSIFQPLTARYSDAQAIVLKVLKTVRFIVMNPQNVILPKKLSVTLYKIQSVTEI